MWVPSDAATLEQAVRDGLLEEGPNLDAKRDPPTRAAELAKDIAAMATDGGTLIFGVGEDEAGKPTVLAPFALVGVRERIDQIVQTSIDPSPVVDIRALPAEDGTTGYVVVLVPPSPLAPHQVTVGGDLRFYGRGATGNRRLTERDVDRLYERRRRWDVDREALLAAEMGDPWPDSSKAFMYGFVRAVAARAPLLETAAGGNELAHLQTALDAFRNESVTYGHFTPSLGEATAWERRGASGWTATSDPHAEMVGAFEGVAHVEIDADGTTHLFVGRIGFAGDNGRRLFFRDPVLSLLADLFTLTARVWEPAGYAGPVDAGVGLAGLLLRVPYELRGAHRGSAFTENEFRATARLTWPEFIDADAAARGLLRRFLNATGG